MDLYEHQGKELLREHGLETLPGIVAGTPEEARRAAETLGGTVAIKAQVLTGGRGKAGGVKFSPDAEAARSNAENILGLDIKGHVVQIIWVENASDIDEEYYASFTLDRSAKKHLGMLSAEGGVEIETVAEENPDAIAKIHIDPVEGLSEQVCRDWVKAAKLNPKATDGAVDILVKLYRAYVEGDADLVEINPLILTGDGEWLAIDSKMSFDDSALSRHPKIEEMRDLAEENETEIEAKQHGISFVKLDGNIGCIVNGAGLAMATMDAAKLHGGEPANFLDVGGGANAAQVAKAFSLVTADPNVKAILINIFGGITRGDEVANGIREALGQVQVDVPIVVRLSGTNAEEGKEILAEAGITAVTSMDQAAAEVVRAANA